MAGGGCRGKVQLDLKDINKSRKSLVRPPDGRWPGLRRSCFISSLFRAEVSKDEDHCHGVAPRPHNNHTRGDIRLLTSWWSSVFTWRKKQNKLHPQWCLPANESEWMNNMQWNEKTGSCCSVTGVTFQGLELLFIYLFLAGCLGLNQRSLTHTGVQFKTFKPSF